MVLSYLTCSSVEAQSCTTGFPSSVSACSSCTQPSGGSDTHVRLIPGMTFTCTGTITGWRAAGVCNDGGNRDTDAKLGIWRETSTSNSMTYERMATIDLGSCGSNDAAEVTDNIYECMLPESLKVSVQPGYIIGIDLVRDRDYRFRLYFDGNSGLLNYEYRGNRSTAALDSSDATQIMGAQPQISLTVEMATTQPPTTTVATTEITMMTTTQPPTTTTVAIMPTQAIPTTDSTSTTKAQTTMMTTQDTMMTTMDDQTPITSELSSTASGEDKITVTSASGNPGEVSNADAGTIAGAIVGAVIAISLVVVVVLLLVLVLVLRRQQTSHKYDTNGTNIINPVYDGELAGCLVWLVHASYYTVKCFHYNNILAFSIASYNYLHIDNHDCMHN